MPTPHISAQPGEFAEVVLMPGDPLRAAHIAERFLADVRCVTRVRNMLGYTGTWRGKPVSVMGHGMGIPSCSIYATELVQEYGVKTLIRVGSCGAISPDLKIRDIVLAMGAGTDSRVNRLRLAGHDFAAIADYGLLHAAVGVARARGVAARVGNVFSSDLFYHPEAGLLDALSRMGILAMEMEVAGLYGVAAERGARALGILTISDHLRTGEHLSSDERQSSFDEMAELALDTAIADPAA